MMQSSADSLLISDKNFIKQLNSIRGLKSFLLEEAVVISSERIDKIDLGNLNSLSYLRSGRPPSEADWKLMDEKFSNLTSLLTDDLRRKFRIRQLRVLFRKLPLIFLSVSVVLSLLYFMLGRLIEDEDSPVRSFIYYVIVFGWAISQGGLGACAFLATSIVVRNIPTGTDNSVPPSEPIDITDRNFLNARILLGSVFALLFGLPFARLSVENLMGPIALRYVPDSTQILYTLLPFLLGFSINLVLVIIGRLLVAIEAFFGVSGRA